VDTRSPLRINSDRTWWSKDGESWPKWDRKSKLRALNKPLPWLGCGSWRLPSRQIQTARDQLKGRLLKGGPVPDAPFGRFEGYCKTPAVAYKNRHAVDPLTDRGIGEAMDRPKRSAQNDKLVLWDNRPRRCSAVDAALIVQVCHSMTAKKTRRTSDRSGGVRSDDREARF